MSEFQTEEHHHCIYSLHYVDHNNLVVSVFVRAGAPSRKGYTNFIEPKYPLMGDISLNNTFKTMSQTSLYLTVYKTNKLERGLPQLITFN